MRKKLFPVTFALVVSASVSGCPVYDDDSAGCFDDYDCLQGYYCDYPSGACVREGSGPSESCSEPNDCAANETCSKSGICAAGDCHFASVGCVRGFECSGESGSWTCVREGSSSGGGGEASGGAPPSSSGAPTVSGGEGGAGGAAEPTTSGGAPLEPGAGAGGG